MSYEGREHFKRLRRQRLERERKSPWFRPNPDDYEEKDKYVFQPYHGWDKRGLNATDD